MVQSTKLNYILLLLIRAFLFWKKFQNQIALPANYSDCEHIEEYGEDSHGNVQSLPYPEEFWT